MMIRRLQIGWLSFGSVALLAMLGVTIWAYWPQPREATIYAFRMPVMFPYCLHYLSTGDEVMSGWWWDFEQPTLIEVGARQSLTVDGPMRFTSCPFDVVFLVGEFAALVSPVTAINGARKP